MHKFKIPLQKELLQVGEIMVIITGDTLCHGQVICSALYALVIMQHQNVSCLFIVNGDNNMIREIEDRIVPGHREGAF